MTKRPADGKQVDDLKSSGAKARSVSVSVSLLAFYRSPES
jgi:hypothetical protein